ncbi:hypothetical protein ACAW74_25905 [Fibrella sp. WM1]|uniref:hypothetical protein n=1 Tax=Fibrella musci TaxID=3242485 RepID=UPI0035214EB8
MAKSIVDLQTALAIALASIPALLTVLWSIWQHNKRVDDLRDLLRAEIKSSGSEILLAVEGAKQKIETISSKVTGLEEDIKRSLAGIDSINQNSKEATRSIIENAIKLRSVSNDISEQKRDKTEIRQNLSNFEKIVSEMEKSLNATLRVFESRLLEIEKEHTKKLDEYIRELRDKK